MEIEGDRRGWKERDRRKANYTDEGGDMGGRASSRWSSLSSLSSSLSSSSSSSSSLSSSLSSFSVLVPSSPSSSTFSSLPAIYIKKQRTKKQKYVRGMNLEIRRGKKKGIENR